MLGGIRRALGVFIVKIDVDLIERRRRIFERRKQDEGTRRQDQLLGVFHRALSIGVSFDLRVFVATALALIGNTLPCERGRHGALRLAFEGDEVESTRCVIDAHESE
jgi:hypothetical protein